MAWYNFVKKKTRKLAYYPKKKSRKYATKSKKFNKKNKVVGPTPDYILSPFDAIPGAFILTKAPKAVRRTYSFGKSAYRKYKSGGKGQMSSPSSRRKPRRAKYYGKKRRYYGKRRKEY